MQAMETLPGGESERLTARPEREIQRALLAFGAVALVLASVVTLVPSVATATSWPSRPVVTVVPFATGGAGNGSVRILAEIIAPKLGQSLVVENRPGAGGITGTTYVTKNDSDHLLLMGSTSMTILPALRADLPYDVQRDLKPIGLISRQPQVLAVATASSIESLSDLIAKAKASDGLTVGNSGIGTLSHLTTELINQKLGTRLVPVPYKGDAALLPDTVGDSVSVGIFNLPVAMPMIASGKLRALAVTAGQPVQSLARVPTLASIGGPEFVIDGWAALFAARNVPSEGVDKFSALLKGALNDPGVRERFAVFGVTPASGDRAELEAFMKSELDRWGGLIKSRGIKLQ